MLCEGQLSASQRWELDGISTNMLCVSAGFAMEFVLAVVAVDVAIVGKNRLTTRMRECQLRTRGRFGTCGGKGGGNPEGRNDSSARPNRVRRMHGKRHAGPKRVARQKCV